MINNPSTVNRAQAVKSLVDSNIATLHEGLVLLQALSPEQYTQGFKPAFQSTIGAHYRHVLEHYRCFFRQVVSGIICYDDRERQQCLETDHAQANAVLLESLRQLETFDLKDLNCDLMIRDEQTNEPVPTNVARELLFLQSHTVHHYAIIAAMSRAQGVQPDADFGVAIATRSFEQSGGKQSCDNTFEAAASNG